ncbi:MAG: lysine--tRNA ligase, partial [Nanoarchaeota archaeon]|nr:lysine--tRNA ligase [Nanoarchaeota archaeon]
KEVPKKIMDLKGKWHDSKIFDFDKYMGMPYCRIPDPFKCCNSWSEHFTKVWIHGVNELGMNPKLYSVDQLYREGKFEQYIIEIFKNIKEASKIVSEFQQTKKENYIPFDAICPKCGRYANIDSFDLKKKTVHFKCLGKMIKEKIAEGCGFEGEVSFSEGKLQWRFEWPALMCIFNTTYEPMGKDHWEGSWKSLVEIMNRIFKKEPPIPFVYEFFLVDGKKMSASKGDVFVVEDMLKIIEPEILLFFYVKRPEKQRDLELNRIFQLVDEFDFAEKVYFDIEKARSENREENYKRMYELCMHKIPKKCPKRIDYKFLATLSQLFDKETIIKKLKELGHLENVNESDLELIKKRIDLAHNWINKYAPDEMKFEIQSEINTKFNDKEEKALKLFAKRLENKYTEEKLAEEIYNISKESDIEPKEFFKICYRLLINKEKGPRLASFILTIGREKVIEMIKKI